MTVQNTLTAAAGVVVGALIGTGLAMFLLLTLGVGL